MLQSCPYLIVLALPLIALVRGKDARALSVLFLIPAVYVTYFSYSAWHGGQALNLRYFVPSLPFFSILTAYAWRDIASSFRRLWVGAATLGGITLVIFHAATVYRQAPSLVEQETIYLTAPLVIAASIGMLLIASLLVAKRHITTLRGATCAAVIIGIVWSGLVSMTYDFPRAYYTRQWRAQLAESLKPMIRPDSILFLPASASFFGLIEVPQVRFAMPQLDDFESFRPLIDFHLDAGHGVYFWVVPPFAHVLQSRRLLAGLKFEVLYKDYGGLLLHLTSAPTEE
ncbi:MAG: hypothetical protein ACTSVG_05545 [Alphaproteobacteria bacterium]